MKCRNHPELEAVGTCVNCGMAVCDACTTRIAKKSYCPDCADDFDAIKAPSGQPNIVINQSASSSSSASAATAGPAVGAQIKNPGLAALISFFWPGAGQIYNGEIGKGILMMVLFFSTIWFGLGVLVWIWSIFDANSRAKMINARGW